MTSGTKRKSCLGLGLVDFAIGLVNSVLKFFGGVKLQKNCNQSCSSKIFTLGLVHASFSLPPKQAVKQTLCPNIWFWRQENQVLDWKNGKNWLTSAEPVWIQFRQSWFHSCMLWIKKRGWKIMPYFFWHKGLGNQWIAIYSVAERTLQL